MQKGQVIAVLQAFKDFVLKFVPGTFDYIFGDQLTDKTYIKYAP